MVSIIIPAYNAAKTIRKCVKSLITQTCQDIEVVIVNDCSSDDTLSVCQSLAKADNRVKVINLQQNAGVSFARFVGIGQSKGQYLAFVDSDDWLISRDTIQTMLDEIESSGADYVQVGYQHVLDRFGLIKQSCVPSERMVIETPDLFDEYYLSFFGVNKLSVTMWGKLYRRELIELSGVTPINLRMGEDLHFNMMLFPYVRRIVVIPHIGYAYRFGGMTTRYNPYFFDNMLTLYRIKKDLIVQHVYDKASKYIRYELKNVIRSEVRQAIRFGKSEAETMALISDILGMAEIKDLHEIDWESLPDDRVAKAIVRNDAHALYAACKEMERTERNRYRLKRLASAIFTAI